MLSSWEHTTPKQRMEARRRQREWYARHRTELQELDRRRRHEDPGYAERGRARTRKWRLAHPEHHRQYHQQLRLEAFVHYSGMNPPRCVCCGEVGFWFLTLDHINGGGRAKENGRAGHVLYGWLRKRDYPPGYQVLCFNCNSAKGILGRCPHQEGKVTVFPMEDVR